MHIYWLGHSSLKIETKTPLHNEVVLLINPYNLPKTDLPRNLKSDLTLLTAGAGNTITLSGEPFVISSPGEYESKGVRIYAIALPQGNAETGSLIFHFETENLSLVYLDESSLKRSGTINDEEMDKLGAIDILFLPGVSRAVSTEEISKLINQLEPRIVIPHSFNPPGRRDPFETIDKLARLLGQKEKEWLPKFKVTKKDLPQEETKLILLEKS